MLWNLRQGGGGVSRVQKYPLNKSLFSHAPHPLPKLLGPGETNPARIQKNVQEAIAGQYSLFCLGFGFDVSYAFLEKLALDNGGLARRIYEDSDSALQLQVPECPQWPLSEGCHREAGRPQPRTRDTRHLAGFLPGSGQPTADSSDL